MPNDLCPCQIKPSCQKQEAPLVLRIAEQTNKVHSLVETTAITSISRVMRTLRSSKVACKRLHRQFASCLVSRLGTADFVIRAGGSWHWMPKKAPTLSLFKQFVNLCPFTSPISEPRSLDLKEFWCLAL